MIREDYAELKNLTPERFDCGVGPCPAIYETKHDTYLIIGKLVEPSEVGLGKKVAAHERLIEIPRELLLGRKE